MKRQLLCHYNTVTRSRQCHFKLFEVSYFAIIYGGVSYPFHLANLPNAAQAMDNKPFKKNNYGIDGFSPRRANSRTNVDPSLMNRQLRRRPNFATKPPEPTVNTDSELPRPQIGQSYTQATSATPLERQISPRRSHLGRSPNARAHKNHKKRDWKKIIKRSSVVLGVLVVLTVGWLGYKFYVDSSSAFGGNLFGFLHPTKLNGEDQGRVNIMLTGVSTDDPGHQGADLTDSIMIISLDTKNNQAQLISIPRDLWVNIPNHGYAKINAANYYGDADNFSEAGYPKGGMGLLEEVLTHSLNIKIQYYAKINYAAIRDGVNAVGGIDYTIKSSDPRGLYDPSIDWSTHGPLVKLSNGKHHLNGEQALDLARARGDAYGSYGFPASDFDRTEHQRQMLIALKDKAGSLSTLSNPVKLGNLLDTMGKNVRTNFKSSEIRRFYDLMKNINAKNIQSISLTDANGKNLLANFTSSDGESALIPAAGAGNYSDIQLFLRQAMSNNPIVKEAAKIVILNGGSVNGLASAESNVLTNKGLNIVSVANAPKQYSHSIIIDNSKGKKTATLKLLESMYGTHVTKKDTVGYDSADFILILGTNVQPPPTISDSGNRSSTSG